MGYSPIRKSTVLKRMLPPNNLAIRQLSQDEGISEATLHKWRAEARSKGQLLPAADAGPEGWSSRDKFAAVLETAPCSMQMQVRNTQAAGQEKPATGNPPDPSGLTPKPKSAPLKSETPHEIGGKLV